MQANIEVQDGVISGTVYHLSDGELAEYWGTGWFLALSFVNNDGVAPENIVVSGSPLDDEYRGAWQVKRDSDGKAATKIVVVTTDGENTLTQEYTLDLEFAE